MSRKKKPAASRGMRQDPYDYQDGYYLEDMPPQQEDQEELPRRGRWWKVLLLVLLALVAALSLWAVLSPDFADWLRYVKNQAGQLLRVLYQKFRAVF